MLLSRLPSLDCLLLLRAPDRAALSAGPPAALLAALSRFEDLQQAMLMRVDRLLAARRRHGLRALVTQRLLQASATPPDAKRPRL